MDELKLQRMTRALCHELYKEWENDEAIKYAFDKLGMDAVNADTVKKNARSQLVIEKTHLRRF